MGFALSSGPFQYNRFDVLNEKKADKDYDGDGKVESSKAEYFGSKDKAIKKACGCKKEEDCDCSSKKEEYVSDVQTLIDEGIDLSGYTWDGLYQEYITEGLPPALLQAIMKKKMGKGKKEVKENREMAYGGGKPGKGSGDGSKPKGITGGKTYTMKGKDGKPLFKEDIEQIDEISKELATKAYAERRTNEVEGDQLHTKSNKTHNRIVNKHGEKAGKDADKAVDKKLYGESIVKESVTKDDVLEFMLEKSLANNVVSAEVLFNHISDEFLESIEEEIMEGFMPLPKEKMARQANKAYGKEQQAVRAGDAAGVNKQMQRRNAMTDSSSRRQALLNKNANK